MTTVAMTTMAGTLPRLPESPARAPAAPPRTIIGTGIGPGCPPAAVPAAVRAASPAEARAASLAEEDAASLASPAEASLASLVTRPIAPLHLVRMAIGMATHTIMDPVIMEDGTADGLTMPGPPRPAGAALPPESPASRAEDPRAANREEDPAPESPASPADLAPRLIGPARATMAVGAQVGAQAMDGADLPPGTEDGIMMMMMTGPARLESPASPAEAREASPADQEAASQASLVTPPLLGA